MRLARRFSLGLRRDLRQRATVLFEVVAALLLFVGAAAIITAGLNASLNSVERLRLNTQATSLAVSVVSELQMGIKSLALTGPQPFEPPWEGWTWEAVALPIEGDAASAPFRHVEVAVRHEDPAVAYRVSAVIRLPEPESGGAVETLLGSSSF